MVKAKSPEHIDEVKVHFPEEKVGPYILRPWTMQQLSQAIPVLFEMLEAFVVTGLEINKIEDFSDKDAMVLLPAASPFFPRLAAITLRLPLAEVEEINKGTLLALGLKIQQQNSDEIKNFFAGLFEKTAENPAGKITH